MELTRPRRFWRMIKPGQVLRRLQGASAGVTEPGLERSDIEADLATVPGTVALTTPVVVVTPIDMENEMVGRTGN